MGSPCAHTVCALKHQIADQRTDVARADAERQALSRLDKMRADQGKRVSMLGEEAAESMQRAALIEYNLEAVDAAIDAVNAAIATGGAVQRRYAYLVVLHAQRLCHAQQCGM